MWSKPQCIIGKRKQNKQLVLESIKVVTSDMMLVPRSGSVHAFSEGRSKLPHSLLRFHFTQVNKITRG